MDPLLTEALAGVGGLIVGALIVPLCPWFWEFWKTYTPRGYVAFWRSVWRGMHDL